VVVYGIGRCWELAVLEPFLATKDSVSVVVVADRDSFELRVGLTITMQKSWRPWMTLLT